MHSGFQTRVLIVVVGALVGAGAISLIAVNHRIRSDLYRDQRARLRTADQVYSNSVLTRVGNLRLRYGAVAREQLITTLLPESDADKMRRTLRRVQEVQDCDALLYQTARGSAEFARPGMPGVEDLREMAQEAMDQAADDTNSFYLAAATGRLFEVMGVPLRDENAMTAGGLVFIDEVQAGQLDELARLTACRVEFLAGSNVLVSSSRPSGRPGEQFLESIGRPVGAPEGSPLRYLLIASLYEPLRALQQTRLVMASISLLGLVVSGLAVWVFIRRATWPLRLLGQHAEAVGRGDFSRRSAIVSKDEFGLLGEAFNRMTENLDVSRRELEQAMANLQRTREQLVQREKLSALGEFVAGVTHELNNPLTAIIGYAEMLKAAELPAEQGADVDAILNGAQRCQRIVRNLLGFARQNKPERRPAELNAMVEDVLAFMGYELRNGHVTVVKRLAADLPRCQVDTHQIQQVFLNILSNARQAMEGFRPDPRIEVRTEAAGGRLRALFIDNGPGIAPENLSRIFDPFFTTKPAGRGTGLGLSLSYGIIQEHGGTIAAESTPGQGTTFIIELPALAGAAVGADQEARPPLPDQEGGGRRVLVVEDEPCIRELVAGMLTPHGYAVSGVSDGEEALRFLKEQPADLIVCDLRMPGLDGLAFYDRLRTEYPAMMTRVIFMTGDVMNPAAQQLEKEQGRICLAKPFTSDEFRRALLRIIREAG